VGAPADTYMGLVNFLSDFKVPQDLSFVEYLMSFHAYLPNIEFLIDECTTFIESLSPGSVDMLSMEELLAVTLYTWDLKREDGSKNFFYVANKVLQKRNQQKLTQWAVYFYHFQNALAKIPSCVVGSVVYRGVPEAHRKEVEANYYIGRRIHWSGYSSSSLKLKTAMKFAGGRGGVIMKITVLDGKPLGRFSPYNEAEILLSPNMQLIVTKPMYRNEADGFFYVELSQMDPKKTYIF